ncbi:MAG TPA: hypothetical protein ENL04_03825 [Sulfuricurvum sp.]|nr:hypothetical protein [Sulfuricurvum sp.]
MKTILLFFTLALSLFGGVGAGETFPPLTLNDAFEKQHTIDNNVRIVIITFEHDVSEKVNDFLAQKPAAFLTQHHAVYIADISSAPYLVKKLFILPKMRDFAFPLLLIEDEGLSKRFDRREGKVTVYRIEKGSVTSTEFIDPEAINQLLCQPNQQSFRKDK